MTERQYEVRRREEGSRWINFKIPERHGSISDGIIDMLEDIQPGEIKHTLSFSYRVKGEEK